MKAEIDREKTGERLRELMAERQVTPQDLKGYLQLNCVQTVYRWLDGINIPTLDNFFALSRMFDVSMDEMLIAKPDPFADVQKENQAERGKLYYKGMQRRNTL